jgi:Golgi nucleoside diphosphatase
MVAQAYPAVDDWWKKPLAAGCAVCVVLYMLLHSGGGGAEGGGAKRYGCMMDAGSTGSRIHIYRFAQRTDGSLRLENEVFKQLKPGVSSFASEPHKAAESIQPLLDEALKAVPADQHASTPIALYATAGLRLVKPQSASDAILEELRGALAASPFLFDPKDVAITQGKLEGVFAWTTVNFLLGNLDGGGGGADSAPTAGIIDLGGGSTQVVFEPVPPSDFGSKQIIPADTHAMLMGGVPHELFAHSYLGYGLNSAAEKIKMATLPAGTPHPCYLKGGSGADIVGSGDATKCAALITRLVRSTDAELGMNLVASPEITGVEWYIFSYFYDRLVEGYGLAPNLPLTLTHVDAAAAAVCQLGSVAEVAEKYPQAEDPARFCLDVTFCAVLLREGCACRPCAPCPCIPCPLPLCPVPLPCLALPLLAS